MRKNIGKSLTNLDLKLLDVKFIAIDDNQFYLTEALQSMKKSKNYELPSLLRSNGNQKNSLLDENKNIDESGINSLKNINTTETYDRSYFSILESLDQKAQSSYIKQNQSSISQQKSNFAKLNEFKSNQDQLEQIKQQILLKKTQKLQSQSNHINQGTQQQLQHQELQKYRKKIQNVKKQNQQIHNQISQLYRNKINKHREHFKKVKQIQPFKLQSSKTQSDNKTPSSPIQQRSHLSSGNLRINRVLESQKLRNQVSADSLPSKANFRQKKSVSPVIAQKLDFYENLSKESQFKEELQSIHKKMISNNLHKNFQQYLIASNKRVPEFIKKLRN